MDVIYVFVVFAKLIELRFSKDARPRMTGNEAVSRPRRSGSVENRMVRCCVLPGLFARAQRSGCHCKFTTRLWKVLVAQDTNPAVWTDGWMGLCFRGLCELRISTEIRGLVYSGDGNG